MSGRGYSGVVAEVDPIKKALKTLTQFSDTSQVDLFNRLRVVLPNSQFSYQNEYSKGENQWVEKITGTASATHDPTSSMVDLTVGAPNSKITRQTRRYFRYWSGKTLSSLLTFNAKVIPVGAVFRVGYFDNNNGPLLEIRNDDVYVGVRSGGITQYVKRDQWNVDKLDGNGKSGVNYDFTKSTIFGNDLQWLGVGTVGFAIESPTGELLVVHKFFHSGVVEGTYMRTANLPIRYELETDETFSGTCTVQQICSAVTTEASGNDEGSNYSHAVNSGIAPTSVTTRRSVLAIRPKTLFNAIENRSSLFFKEMEILVGSNNCLWEIVWNPTFTAPPTWDSVGADSTVEYSIDASAFTGGIVVRSGYGPAGGGATRSSVSRELSTNYPLGLDIDGANPTSIALVCTSLSGTALVNATLNWEEIY